MEHLLLKAAVTATQDKGEFTAIAAAYTVDRVNDRIIPGAFAKTIQRWRDSGKLIPLHWNHSGQATDIIGSINPATMEERDDGLYVEGRMDINSSDTAKEAWRSVKNGTMSLSFGYLATEQKQQKDGVNDLLELDLFEISVVPTPANADTRILTTKNADDPGMFPQDDEVNAKAVWTTAYINDLPDSSFLYIEPGGSKDSDGKTTPRSLRHFPVRDASGAVDLPHLRNALARIPQSSLSQSIKDRVTATAQRMLSAANKTVDASRQPNAEPDVDPLRTDAKKLALRVLTGDVKPPPVAKEEPKQLPDMDPQELRRYSRDLIVSVLTREVTT